MMDLVKEDSVKAGDIVLAFSCIGEGCDTGLFCELETMELPWSLKLCLAFLLD